MPTSMKVSIVGQGYVGLPLAMAAVRAGLHVTGIDVSMRVIERLNQGQSHVEDISNQELQAALDSGLYRS